MMPDFLDRLWSVLNSRAIALFPAVLATLFLLLVGWVVSLVVAGLVRRLLRRLGLDERVRESGLGDPLSRAGISRPASAVMARLVFWLVFVCFGVLALETLGLELSDLPIEAFVAYVPRVIGAAIILLVGVLLAAFLGRATDAGLAGMGVDLHQRVGVAVQWLLTALTVIVTVDQLGFDIKLLTDTFTSLLTIVAAGLALAFAWGGREVARNVLAGYYVKETFRFGSVLTVDGHEGRLEEIGTLNCRLATAAGTVLVPNSRLLEQTVELKAEPDE